MEKFIRHDDNLLEDIDKKLDDVIMRFVQVYGTYLRFLSNANYGQTGGISWAPLEQARTIPFNIAYEIIVTSIDTHYYDEAIDWCIESTPILLKSKSELGNILIVPMDTYINYGDDRKLFTKERIKNLVRRSLSSCNTNETPDRIIFVPLSDTGNVEDFVFLKFKDNYEGLIEELEELCLKYYDANYTSFKKYSSLFEYTKKDIKTIQVMSFSDFLDNINVLDKEDVYNKLDDLPNLIALLKKERIGSLFNNYKDLYFELFKFSSNLCAGTNYDIDIFKTNVNILNKDFYCVEQKEINEMPKANINQSIVFEANKNVNLLKEWNLYQLIITSEFLFMEYNGITGFDNTFIVSGYFKSIELLLYNVLEKFYSDIKILDGNYYKEIIISPEFEVGRMNEIVAILTYEKYLGYYEGKLLFDKIEKWKKLRNGYFHKDVLTSNECIEIKKATCEVIFYIIGILPVRKISKSEIVKPLYLFKKNKKNKIRELNF